MRKINVPCVAVLLLAIFALTLTGCGGNKVSLANYDRIKEGMTESEVEGILGKGEEKASSSLNFPGKPGGGKGTVPGIPSSIKVKLWQDGKKAISITFADGKVMNKIQNGL